MICHRPMTLCVLLAGLIFVPASSLAQTSSSSSQKVLEQVEGGFNVGAIESLLKKADRAAAKGDLSKARILYDKARDASKQLVSFYRDLSGSFRGLDARIPREMDKKGRESLVLLAKVNLRLAALFRRTNQPEIAVPILVEVVRLMSPTQPEGKKAYQRLIELGFVETPYRGSL